MGFRGTASGVSRHGIRGFEARHQGFQGTVSGVSRGGDNGDGVSRHGGRGFEAWQFGTGKSNIFYISVQHSW